MDSAIVNLKRRQVAALQIAPLGGPYDIFPTGSLRRSQEVTRPVGDEDSAFLFLREASRADPKG